MLERVSTGPHIQLIRSMYKSWFLLLIVNCRCFLLADVKEFVHGDLGRTIPSIGSLLGCKADILQLDCEGIQSHFNE
jgi:hypothetical protein